LFPVSSFALLQRPGCLHHVCGGCTASGDGKSCPIPDCGHAFGCAAAALPTDRMVLAGVAAAGGPRPTPKCDDCDDEANLADATRWCPTCKLLFCEDCAQPHFTRRGLKTHPIQAVEKYDATGSAHGSVGDSTKGCQLHHKPHEFFCLTCHAIGCSTCIITGHKDDSHKTGLLEEMAGLLRATLKQCDTPLGAHCETLHALMNDVQTTRAALDQNEEVALAAVDQVATEARQELNKTVSGKKTEVAASCDCV
jgi:hypothetical protein